MVGAGLTLAHQVCLEQHATLLQLGFLCLTDFAADAGTALATPCLRLEQGCLPLLPPYTWAVLTSDNMAQVCKAAVPHSKDMSSARHDISQVKFV